MASNKEISLAAFETADYINGSLSGGIEAPRIIKNVTEENGRVIIEYTYNRLGGLSDCVYHDTRAGKMYKDEYVFDDGEITLNGSDDYLGTQGFDDSYVIEAVNKFHNEFPMIKNKYAA